MEESQQRVEREKDEMMSILDEYFNRGVAKGKFIDTARIPLICQDISQIHKAIDDIKSNQTWIARLIIGAVVLALLALITHKP